MSEQLVVCSILHPWYLPLLQIRDNKTSLANWETQDMGKPIDEAEWDMVSSSLQPMFLELPSQQQLPASDANS